MLGSAFALAPNLCFQHKPAICIFLQGFRRIHWYLLLESLFVIFARSTILLALHLIQSWLSRLNRITSCHSRKLTNRSFSRTEEAAKFGLDTRPAVAG